MGIQCALCHSTVDDSFAPGIGKRLDGWANRDLNVGAIVSLAPNLKPFTDLLGVDEATVKKVLASWGPGRFDALLDKDGKALRPDGKQAGTLIPPAFGLGGREPAHLDRLRLGSVLERLRRRHRDARLGHLLRRAPRQQGAVPRLREERLAQHARRRADQINGEAGRAALLPAGDPGAHAARGQLQRGGRRARQGGVRRARRAARRCHVPPLFTEPGHNVHAPTEIGVDSFQADRSPTHAIARRRSPACGRTRRAASITTAASRRCWTSSITTTATSGSD